MMTYYSIFGLMLSGLSLALVQQSRTRRPFLLIFTMLIFLLLTLFSGLRSPYLDADYSNYVNWFNEIRFGVYKDQIWQKDPAYFAISLAAATIGLKYLIIPLFYAFIALATNFVLAYFVASEQALTIYLYLIFCRFYVLLDMTQIRAAVAIPVMSIAIYYGCAKKPLTAVICYMLALSFHLSVVIGLPFIILILCGVQFKSRKWVALFAPLYVFVRITFGSILSKMSNIYRISDYVGGQSDQDALSLLSFHVFLHIIIILIVVIFLWKKLFLFERIAVIYSGFGVFLYSVFIEETVLASRFEQIFDLLYLTLFVVIFNRLSKKWQLTYLAAIGVLGLFLFQSTIGIVKPYAFYDALH